MNTKAMMAIGTLIVFIAGILVASMAAGVILTTQSTLQNKALEVGSKARRGISINFQTQDIRMLQNPSTGNYDTLEMVTKLGPGSEDVRLNKTLIDVITGNGSSIVRYTGNSSYYVNRQVRQLYNDINLTSWTRLHTDLDFDFIEDTIHLYNSSLLQVNLSTEGIINVSITNISTPGVMFNDNYSIGTQWGSIGIVGMTSTSNVLDGNGMEIYVYPYSMYINFGGFQNEFLIMDNPHKNDILVEGDVVRISLETSVPLQEQDELMISLKKEDGQIHRVRVSLPDVIVGSRVRIYP